MRCEIAGRMHVKAKFESRRRSRVLWTDRRVRQPLAHRLFISTLWYTPTRLIETDVSKGPCASRERPSDSLLELQPMSMQ